ncbi:chemotaxis protein CheB [Aquimarina intermedia]|uniref:chemotaxis protein CheB n=1 Tax=Aquimarina intermedia TaxID=350814 RepID=UPI001FEB487D|nr:chemotaxis protein CheB [Aquimarina intermedia]
MGYEVSNGSKNNIIVAVGASAGGLQALSSFFDNTPEHSEYTFVIIQHLSPDHKSLMGELLAKNTKIPIVEISDNSPIKPGHIYMIPPTKNLRIDGNHFVLIEKPKGKTLNLPIDMFFESMAEHFKENCVGIVLSGTGSDGSRGILSIKEQGGIVIVQQPEQANFDGMPESAINTGAVDFILPVQQMISEIDNYFKTPTVIAPGDDEMEYDEKVLQDILALLKKSTDLDFSLYKKPTLVRRMARRIKIIKADSLPDYLAYLKAHPEEIQILHKEFLIGVTKFFRDLKVWDILESEVVPELVRQKFDGEVLKIWDVGCSTGEETYSLAIVFLEEIKKQNKKIDLKIFATDISQYHLDIASSAKYDEGIAADVSSERLSEYFKKDDNQYTVQDKVRKNVIFSNHNIIKDPPFNNMDMVVCRNLLIYLQNSVQNNALHVLHYSLRFNGVLLLGTSESLGSQKQYFEEINRKWKIYRNIEASTRLRTEVLKSSSDRHKVPSFKTNSKFGAMGKEPENGFINEISKAVLKQFGAASIHVDDEFNIIDAQGEFYKYATFPSQGFSVNLLRMLSEDLKIAVSTSVRKAMRSNSEYFYKDVLIYKEDAPKMIDIMVKPLVKKNVEKTTSFIITLFEHEIKNDDTVLVEKANAEKTSNKRIVDLEEELEEAKQELKSSIEETETSNEELQAANEELLASNEELQSTNEELQSVNEELHTVNAEHIQKVDDLAHLNADMDNLLNSTKIGTIFLDRELTIRKFTPEVKEHFNLVKQDIGRPIENFISNFGISRRKTLVDSAKKVMETGKVFEKRISSKTDRFFIQRISPFINSVGKIDGVVITFIDITTVHKSQEKLRKSEEKFKTFYEEDPVMHLSVDSTTLVIIECNKLLVKTLGYNSKDEVLGMPIIDIYAEAYKVKVLGLHKNFRKTGKIESEELILLTKNGKEIPVILNAEANRDAKGNVVSSRSTLVNISELKKKQAKIEEQKADLQRANQDLEQFVSICSHDLQEPLGTIRFGSDILNKKYSDSLEPKAKEYIEYIHNASGRLSDQIKALLEHSRIGRDIKMTRVDTKEIVDIVKYDLGKRINECGASIHSGKLPVVNGLKVELRLLFQNLIGNAIKYCKKGVHPDIRINSFKDNGYHIFSIADNGIGMKEKDLESIFTIFNRVPTDDAYEGTGVGLAHCEKIVKLHGGNIWADSKEGVGSTFYFKIKA